MQQRPAVDEVEQAFRAAYGQAIATLVRFYGDITAAEDAVQDAFTTAAERWPAEGVPANPAGWIITTARRRAIDGFRRSVRGGELEREALQGKLRDAMTESESVGDAMADERHWADDQLRLIFTCCHPALRTEHQIALTLRLLGGLTVEEVARAFLVTEAAMARRIGRAKYKIRAANIAYRVPADEDLTDRLASVLSVILLIYNAGADEPAARPTLRSEGVRLARALVSLVPDESEAAGLLALLLLNESRIDARTSVDGSVVLLADQDRRRWNRALIDEGHAIVRGCIAVGRPGPFQLQAAIQAVHGHAATYEETDWPQIVLLYDHLIALLPTPIVAMNRAIAVAETEGAAVALDELGALDDDLDAHHLFHAARADLLRRLGRHAEADAVSERAIALAPTEAQREFLRKQLVDARNLTARSSQ
jgi:RNA polymerase sigma-70 factor (ECF subfamily)